MVSVIIAAHNEAAVISATLGALLKDAPHAEIIVVPNGCTDNTADVARRHPAVRVVEIEEGSKPRALNAGDAVATSFPRVYLDADIIVDPGSVDALVAALQVPGVMAAVPRRRLDTAGRPWLVRSWTSVHRRLPVFEDGLFGRGMIALSEEARSRFREFPIMVADDLFLDSLYRRDEKVQVEGADVVVQSPDSTGELIQRLIRVRRGSAAMRDAARRGELPIRVRQADRWSWLRDVVLRDLRLLPAGIVYALLTAVAAVRARSQPSSAMDWGRTANRTGSRHGPTIGLLGVQADTANLGLGALAYSVVAMIDRALPGRADILLFSVNDDGSLQRMTDELGIEQKTVEAVPFMHKQPRRLLRTIGRLRDCDVVIDFTGGDSFSDIYGVKRLFRKLFHKQLVLLMRTDLVLAPQTYGPVASAVGRAWFNHVVRRARLVFTRDDLSLDFLKRQVDREYRMSTDVAVMLPFRRRAPMSETSGALRIGVNVSGLLWAGGYTRDNQFGLQANYRDYCRAVVEGLLARGDRVFLVPHVQTREWEPRLEDDVAAAEELQAEFPDVELAPRFTSPVDAKSWISQLDALAGSRMHATIAAFSSGVATVPVSYSRKFVGFFGAVGYDVGIDLEQTETAEAVHNTLALLGDPDTLLLKAESALALARDRAAEFEADLTWLLSDLDGN